MKKLVFALFLPMFFMASCSEDGILTTDDQQEINIEDLTYEDLKKYPSRPITDEERRDFINKGWLSPSKTYLCQWSDDPDCSVECSTGDCEVQFYELPMGEVATIACLDGEGNIINAGCPR